MLVVDPNERLVVSFDNNNTLLSDEKKEEDTSPTEESSKGVDGDKAHKGVATHEDNEKRSRLQDCVSMLQDALENLQQKYTCLQAENATLKEMVQRLEQAQQQQQLAKTWDTESAITAAAVQNISSLPKINQGKDLMSTMLEDNHPNENLPQLFTTDQEEGCQDFSQEDLPKKKPIPVDPFLGKLPEPVEEPKEEKTSTLSLIVQKTSQIGAVGGTGSQCRPKA
jgi:hypothetical protein